MEALRRTFSSPVSSGWNPVPSSIMLAILTPRRIRRWPLVARWMPATSLRNVLLPEPFRPTSATDSPSPMRIETFRSAQNSSRVARAADPRMPSARTLSSPAL